MEAVIKKVNPQSEAGPSGLRYSHLQAALCDELAEYLAAFLTLVFSSHVLPHVFWTLRDHWRVVMSCGESLAPSFAPDMAESWKTSSSLGASMA